MAGEMNGRAVEECSHQNGVWVARNHYKETSTVQS